LKPRLGPEGRNINANRALRLLDASEPRPTQGHRHIDGRKPLAHGRPKTACRLDGRLVVERGQQIGAIVRCVGLGGAKPPGDSLEAVSPADGHHPLMVLPVHYHCADGRDRRIVEPAQSGLRPFRQDLDAAGQYVDDCRSAGLEPAVQTFDGVCAWGGNEPHLVAKAIRIGIGRVVDDDDLAVVWTIFQNRKQGVVQLSRVAQDRDDDRQPKHGKSSKGRCTV